MTKEDIEEMREFARRLRNRSDSRGENQMQQALLLAGADFLEVMAEISEARDENAT